jgi:hypothetical protein
LGRKYEALLARAEKKRARGHETLRIPRLLIANILKPEYR